MDTCCRFLPQGGSHHLLRWRPGPIRISKGERNREPNSWRGVSQGSQLGARDVPRSRKVLTRSALCWSPVLTGQSRQSRQRPLPSKKKKKAPKNKVIIIGVYSVLVASLDRCLSLVSVVPEADVFPGFFLCLDHFLDILGFQCVPGSSLAQRRKLSGELLALFHTPTELYLFIYFLAD